MSVALPELLRIDPGQRATVSLHPGQRRAWKSNARFVFIFAGTQGGKTSFLPWWLNREIDRTASPKGENDYLAATASYDLFKLKFLPEMRKVFEDVLHRGRYYPSSRVIELCDPEGRFWAKSQDGRMYGRIILRSAQGEGGLESATAKAAILDECGQDNFRVDSWEAVQRRLSLSQGRACGATTLYNTGWVKSQIYDRWRMGDSQFDVVQFASIMNPSFPREEFERVRQSIPPWKFRMFYEGEFSVPEGLIYQPFDTEQDVCDPFPIPDDWPRYGGLDFGGVHTGAVMVAERPGDKHLFLIREYMQGGETTAGHATKLKAWLAKRWWGGAGSEDQWRREFAITGMPVVLPPVQELEVQISAVYAVLATHNMTVFRSCSQWLDEIGSYRREIDASGNTIDKIHDPHAYHLMDATRYLITGLRRKVGVKVVRLGG